MGLLRLTPSLRPKEIAERLVLDVGEQLPEVVRGQFADAALGLRPLDAPDRVPSDVTEFCCPVERSGDGDDRPPSLVRAPGRLGVEPLLDVKGLENGDSTAGERADVFDERLGVASEPRVSARGSVLLASVEELIENFRNAHANGKCGRIDRDDWRSHHDLVKCGPSQGFCSRVLGSGDQFDLFDTDLTVKRLAGSAIEGFGAVGHGRNSQ